MGWFELDLGTPLARKPSRYYLAYGSNLSVERMKARCPNAVAFGLALIPGYRLLFKRSKTGSYATIEQDTNCCVPALVYKISEYDETLLNRYEGYPKYYYKRYFQLPIVRLDTGKRMKEKKPCMAYVMHEERLLGEPGIHRRDLRVHRDPGGDGTWRVRVQAEPHREVGGLLSGRRSRAGMGDQPGQIRQRAVRDTHPGRFSFWDSDRICTRSGEK